jgi:hypothetical protein
VKAMAKKKASLEDLFEVLIYVLFAAAIIPIIAGQVVTLEGDTTNFSASEILIMGLITTFIVLGLVYVIYKKMF